MDSGTRWEANRGLLATAEMPVGEAEGFSAMALVVVGCKDVQRRSEMAASQSISKRSQEEASCPDVGGIEGEFVVATCMVATSVLSHRISSSCLSCDQLNWGNNPPRDATNRKQVT